MTLAGTQLRRRGLAGYLSVRVSSYPSGEGSDYSHSKRRPGKSRLFHVPSLAAIAGASDSPSPISPLFTPFATTLCHHRLIFTIALTLTMEMVS